MDFKDRVKRYSKVSQVNEVTRDEAKSEDVQKTIKKLKNFADKIEKLEEEGSELIKEVNSFRTPKGAFAFKGMSAMQTALAKLPSIKAAVRGAFMKGMAKDIEKWNE